MTPSSPLDPISRALRGTLYAASLLGVAAAHAASPDTPIAVQPIQAPLTPKKQNMLERDYLLGDLWGSRTMLVDKGVSFDLQYVNDYFGVVGGETTLGRNKDFGRVRLTVDIDFEKLVGIPGLTFHVSAINQSGPNIANTIGTYTNPSSIAGEETTRIDTYWLQQKLFNGVLVLRAGQLAQQDDYGVQEYGSSYLLEPLGYAFGNLFGNVTATFDPASKPGVEVQIHPYKGFYAKTMFQAGDPDPYGNDPHGVSFSLEGDGVLASEIGYRTAGTSTVEPQQVFSKDNKEFVAPHDGMKTLFEGLPAVYKFGAYANFGNYTNPSNGDVVHGNYLLYGMINQGLLREGHYGVEAEQGLDAFIGADLSPYDVNFAYFQLTGGLRYTGAISYRNQDVTAIGFVLTDFSNRFDTPTTDYSSETALEMNYKAQITRWLAIQPDFQIFFNPGGQSSRETTFLLGVRANVVF